MGLSVFHSHTATTPDVTNSSFDILPSHWNQGHEVELSIQGSDISGAFTNTPQVSFGTNTAGYMAASVAAIVLAASNGTASSGTVLLANSNNVTWGLNGQTITASISQPAVNGVTLGGNVAGTPQLISAGTLELAGGANITLSQLGSTLTIIGAAGGGGGGGPGIQALSVSNGVVQSSTVSLINANGISFGTSGLGGISASAAFPQAAAIQAIGGTIQDKTAILSNSNNVSFGLNGYTITATATFPAQTGISGLAAGGATVSSGTVVLGNANNVSFGFNGQTLTASITAQSVQPVAISASNSSNTFGTLTLGNSNGLSFMYSNGSVVGSYTVPTQISVGDSNLGNTAGNSGVVTGQLVLVGSNNVTLSGSTNAGSMTVSLFGAGGGNFTGGVSTGGNTSGNTGTASNQLILAGGNNVTLSGSTNGGSITVTVIAGTAANAAVNVTAANTSQNMSTMAFTNSNNVSFSISTGGGGVGSIYASASFSQTAQTLGLLASSNTTASASSGTVDARSLTVFGAGIVSVGVNSTSIGGTTTGLVISASQSAQTVGLYASSQTTASASSQTFDARSLSFIGAGAVSVGLNSTSAGGTTSGFVISAPTQTVQTQNLHDLTLAGNTSGTLALVSSGTLTLAGGNNITLSQVGNAVTVSGAPQAAIGVSNLGNTAGTTSMVTGQVVFAGGNNITLSEVTGAGQAATITISAASTTGFLGGVSTGGNTAGNTGMQTGQLVLQGGQQIVLSESTGAAGAQTVLVSWGGIGINTPTPGSSTQSQIYTLQFTNQNGVSFSWNSLNSAIGASVAPQTAFSAGVSTGGHTAGNTGMYTGQLVLAGGQLIAMSVSSDTNNNQTVTASFQGINVSNSGGNSISGVSQLILDNAGGVSFGVATGNFHIFGSAPAVTFSGNTTGTIQMFSSGTLTLAAGNNITFSQNGNNLSIIGAAAGTGGASSAGVYVQGNTAGASSSSTLPLSSLNISAAGNFTAGLVASSLQLSAGPLSAIVSSNTTGNTSGATFDGRSISLQGYGAISVGLSTTNTGTSIIVSAPGTVALTQFSGGFSTGGNTAGTTGLATAQLVLAGGNNVTLSGSTNAGSMTVSVIAGTAANAAVNVTCANTSENLSTMAFANSNNVSFSLSTGAGGVGSIYATASFNQTAQTVGLYGSSQTTGSASSGTLDARSLTIIGAGAVSVGMNSTSAGGTTTGLIISVPVQSVQTDGIYASSNTFGQSSSSTHDARSLSIVGSGEISVGWSAGSLLFSAPPSSIGISNIGNTVGTSGINSGQVVLAGGNNITLSQSTAAGQAITITISGGAGGGVNTLTYYATGNTTQSSSGTIAASSIIMNGLGGLSAGVSNGSLQLSAPVTSAVVGTNGISVSTNGSTISISNIGTLGIYASSNTTGGASSSTYPFQSLTIVGAGNVSVGWTNSSLVISQTGGGGGGGFTGGVSTGGNTAGNTGTQTGTMLFAGGNNVTLSVSTAAGGAQTITVSGANEAPMGLSNIGNTAGTSSMVTGQLVFAGGNNITLSESTAANQFATITISAANQTVDTLGAYFPNNSTGQSSSSTFDARSMSFSLNNLSGGMSGGQIVLSAANPAANPISIFAQGNTTNSSSGTMPASSFAITGLGGASVGFSSGGSAIIFSAPGTTQFTGANGISVSTNGSSVTVSNLNQIGLSTVGNTSGTTGLVTGNMVLAGLGAATLVQSTAAGQATVSVSVPQLSLYAIGNTTSSASSSSYSLGSISVSGAGAVSVGFSGASGLVISAPVTSNLVGTSGLSVSTNGSTISVLPIAVSRSIWPEGNLTGLTAPGNATASVQYIPLANILSASRVDLLVSISVASAATTATAAIAISAYAAIYTRNASTLSSLSSGSTQTTYSYASNTAGATYLQIAAIRPISVPVNIVATPGEYFLAFNMVTATSSVGASTTSFAPSISVIGGNQLLTATNYAEFGSQTATSTGLYGGMGVYSAATTGLPAAISLSAINQTGSALSAANIALVLRNV